MASGPRSPRSNRVTVLLMIAGTTVLAVAHAADIKNTKWTLATLAARPSDAQRHVTLEFEADRVQGSDGCNRYSGPFSVTGSKLQIGPKVASTLMGCPTDVMEQASAYVGALMATHDYRLRGGELQLLGARGEVLATFKEQSLSLSGSAWHVTAINNGSHAVASVATGTALTMAFSNDGKISGTGGCNHYSATYAAAGSTLTVAAVANTRLMCARPTGVMDQEQQFLRALETVATMRLDQSRLELRRADGGLAVSLTRD